MGQAGVNRQNNFHTGYGPVVDFVKQDRRGFFVVCMYGVLYYDYQLRQFRPSTLDFSGFDEKLSIRGALFDSQGNFYICTSGRGLMVVPKGELRPVQVDNVTPLFDLTHANVSHIIEDRDHNLWMTCTKRGLFMLRRSKQLFNTWRFSNRGYTLGSSVSSMAPAEGGDVLCVGLRAGIFRFNRNGRITARLKSPAAPISLFRDKAGRYWLGAEDALYAYDPATEQAVKKLSVEGWGLMAISDDGGDNLFIANDGKGLIIYNKATGQTRQYSMNDREGKLGTLVNDWIRAFCYDSRGLLWIGTVSGLGCMDPRTGNMKPLGWNRQFTGHQCYSLREMPDGNIVVGTEPGLYTYDRLSGKFASVRAPKPCKTGASIPYCPT